MKHQLSIALGLLCMWTGAVLAADAAHVLAPTPAPAPVISVGDSWTYQYTDLWKHAPGNLNRVEITAVDADGVHAEIRRAVGNALVTRQLYSSDMNPIDRGKMHFAPAFGRYAFPLEPGKTWKTDAIGDNKEAGKHWRFQVTGHAGEWEKITVAAGQFDAIKSTSWAITSLRWSMNGAAAGPCAKPCGMRRTCKTLSSWSTRTPMRRAACSIATPGS
jgi:hypothetical protein